MMPRWVYWLRFTHHPTLVVSGGWEQELVYRHRDSRVYRSHVPCGRDAYELASREHGPAYEYPSGALVVPGGPYHVISPRQPLGAHRSQLWYAVLEVSALNNTTHGCILLPSHTQLHGRAHWQLTDFISAVSSEKEGTLRTYREPIILTTNRDKILGNIFQFQLAVS